LGGSGGGGDVGDFVGEGDAVVCGQEAGVEVEGCGGAVAEIVVARGDVEVGEARDCGLVGVGEGEAHGVGGHRGDGLGEEGCLARYVEEGCYCADGGGGGGGVGAAGVILGEGVRRGSLKGGGGRTWIPRPIATW